MDRDGTSRRAVDPGAFYRGMFQHPDVAFFVIQVSPDGQYLIEDGNKALEKWLGRPIEEMRGRPVREWLAPPGIEFLESNLRIAIEKRDNHSYDRAIDLADGALSWSTTLIPVVEGNGPVTHVLGMVRDIVHEKRPDGDASHYRALTDQRHRLVETLHEATGQHLAAADLALMRLEIFAAPHESDRGKELDEALGDARASIEEIKREIGVLTYVLRPPVLDSHDFGEALRIFAEGFGRRSGTAVDLRIAPEAYDFPLLASMPLFRVLQEAFANVHRHAHATRVAVALDVADGEAVLTVADNGVGFDARAGSIQAQDGNGLAGMRARMVQLGGTFEISSHGAGTTIVARSPLAACLA
jgi:PAS domain S-box-containing protein